MVLQLKIVNISIFERARIDLLGSLSDILGLNITRLGMQSLFDWLIFGNLSLVANRMIMEATINFINATLRIDSDTLFWDVPLIHTK